MKTVKNEVVNAPKTAKTIIKSKGIISTIVESIEKSGKKGISKEAILNLLIKEFPDRSADSMKNTINVQVPSRISKERFPLVRMDNGNYMKK